MIKVYAIDPAVFTDLEKAWRLFVGHLGPTRGRLICKLPEQWLDAVEATCGDSWLARERAVQLRQQLGSKAFAERNTMPFLAGRTWLENAIVEHQSDPFDALVVGSEGDAINLGPVYCWHELDDSIESWQVPQSFEWNRRRPDDLVAALSGVLRYARRIRFVDPYFYPHEGGSDFKPTLKKFLEICAASNVAKDVCEFHVSYEKIGIPHDEFAKRCQELRTIVPSALGLRIVRWKARQGGEKIHDRYVLTELGGVMVGYGLKKGKGTTTCTRLEYSVAQNRYSAFDQSSSEYEYIDEAEVWDQSSTNRR